MEGFFNIDEDRMTFSVTGNYSDFLLSKKLYQEGKKDEPVCFCIEDENGKCHYSAMTIEKTQELIDFLVELLNYFIDTKWKRYFTRRNICLRIGMQLSS